MVAERKGFEAKEGVKIIQENVTNMRTIKGLGTEQKSYERFKKAIEAGQNSTCKEFLLGLLYAIGQWGQFILYAVVFYAAAYFIKNDFVDFNQLFRALFSILFGAFGFGFAQQEAGNAPKAAIAAVS